MNVYWIPCVLFVCVSSCVQTQEIANGEVECYAGSVSCNEGYLYTKNQPVFHGAEMALGECRRYIWSGEEANELRHIYKGFPMPREPSAGWAVCVTAVPTRYTRASVDFLGDEDRSFVSHFDIRMQGRHNDYSFGDTLVVNEAEMDEDGAYQWGEQDTYHPYPYPFAVGKEFTVKILASDEYTLKYYVNGKEEATRNIRTSISGVTKVVVQGDVDVSQVNIWCV